MHYVLNGRTETPKHTLLAHVVRHMTGSAQLNSLLNWFGHSISNSQALEVETAIAKEILKETEDNVVIPSNIDTTRPVVWAYDNNDITEETRKMEVETVNADAILKENESTAVAPLINNIDATWPVVYMWAYDNNDIAEETRTLEVETAIAEEILKETDNTVVIPSNIDTTWPVLWAYDNYDINEDTGTGGTTHCTNGIVLQRSVKFMEMEVNQVLKNVKKVSLNR